MEALMIIASLSELTNEALFVVSVTRPKLAPFARAVLDARS